MTQITPRYGRDILYLPLQAQMAPYDPMLDYAGITIQFGYVTMFSVVFGVRSTFLKHLSSFK